MGLLDKYIAKVAGAGPDVPSLMTRLLESDDTYLSWTTASPEGFTRESQSVSLSWSLINTVVDKAMNAAVQGKHIGGAPGSIATTLPTDGEALTLVVSRSGLSAWRFLAGAQGDPSLYYRINADHLRSITDVTERQANVRIIRVTFADESFFDYRIMNNFDEFLAGCQQLIDQA